MKYRIDEYGGVVEGQSNSDRLYVIDRIKEIFSKENWSIRSNLKFILIENLLTETKYTISLKAITHAQRKNEKEFRVQLNDKDISRLKDSKGNSLISNPLFSKEIFIPLGYYHDSSNNVLIFSTLDPRRIHSNASVRSYYINIEPLSNAFIGVISFDHDSQGERIISFIPENLIGILAHMDLFFSE